MAKRIDFSSIDESETKKNGQDKSEEKDKLGKSDGKEKGSVRKESRITDFQNPSNDCRCFPIWNCIYQLFKKMSSQPNLPILCISTPSQISQCLATYQELRPHLTDEKQYIDQILKQQSEDGFKLNAISIGDEIVALIGYRIMTTTAWGKIVYIDDLVCKATHRGKGLGSQLLHFVDNFARENGCKQVHLDSGYQRNAAHKVYLNNGYILGCHHFIKTLN